MWSLRRSLNRTIGRMTCSIPATEIVWPGFQHDGGLLLPLPAGIVSLPCGGSLELDGERFVAKQELHVTLLNRALGNVLRNALGMDTVRRYFEDQNWVINRTGDGQLLHKLKQTAMQPLACGSIIERLDVPALAAFRTALAHAAKLDVPALLPHVTLYVAGDPAGIGLPDLAALHAAHVANVRLPCIGDRAPLLLHELLAAYQAAHFVIEVTPPITIKIDEASLRMDTLLQEYGSKRGIIVTAFNPFSDAVDSRANDLRQQMLCHALDDADFHALDAQGIDPQGRWLPERSLLVFDTEAAFEDRLLQDYEQHSLVVVTRGKPAAIVLHPDHRH